MIQAIDAVLPQTQCRQCGFDGCKPYAAAIASGAADIDRCPPGGESGVAKLAAVTGRPPVPLNSYYGMPKALALAVIDEAICIGCTLCIQACPVDAIVGGAKRMHDVVPDLCTGCELCIAPCPVDCIRMEPAGYAWTDVHAADARARHEARARRLERIARDDGLSRQVPEVAGELPSHGHDHRRNTGSGEMQGAGTGRVDSAASTPTPPDAAAARRRAIVDAAVARASLRRAARAPALPAPPDGMP